VKQRDALLVLGAVVLAVGVTAVLLVGAIASGPRGEAVRPRFFVGAQPVRAIDAGAAAAARAERAAQAVPVIGPLQRGIGEGARDAAGYLLVLLGVSAALVLAREPVLTAYRATAGGAWAQARIVATGLAVLALLASAAFLAFVVILGTIAGNPALRVPFGVQPLLQSGLVALTVAFVFVALVTLVGLAAASWRLGDAIAGLRPWARLGAVLPAPLVAITGTTLIYLAAQAPLVGTSVGVLAVAYALGAVMAARLGRGAPRAAAAPTPS
jgi:hypothetical protein